MRQLIQLGVKPLEVEQSLLIGGRGLHSWHLFLILVFTSAARAASRGR
jgi:hypothetical protein